MSRIAAAVLTAAALLLPGVALADPAPLPLGADDRVVGYSGKLKAAFVDPGQVLPNALFGVTLPAGTEYRWVPIEGTAGRPTTPAAFEGGFVAPEAAGVWKLQVALAGQRHETALVAVIRVPASAVKNGYLNGYHIGRYPAEGRMGGRYAPPTGFIEVTAENQDLFVSEHFQLKDFLTKDQKDLWPKYLVLDLKLVDKLERVTQELHAMGFSGARLHVMSGYRTPQYNGPGGKKSGRARFSRHTYGDASDVWVDADADGYMDDLNGDGKRDTRDAEFLAAVVERVDAAEPELTGGAGIYKPNRVHGPFVHIDARGRVARWSKK